MEASFLKLGKGHSAAVYTMIKDGSLLLTGSADRMVGAWNTDSLETDKFSVNVGAPVFSLLKLGDLLFIGQGEGGIHLVDMASKKEIRHLKYHVRPVFDMILDRDKGRLYSLGGEGNLSIIAMDDYSLMWSIPISDDKLRCALIDSDQSRLLVGSSDGVIRILETDYFNLLHEISAHEGGVYDMKWLQNGKLITGGRDGHLRYWEWSSGCLSQIEAVPAHNYAIYSIDVAPKGAFFATGSRDKTVKIWRVDNPLNPLRIQRKGPIGHTHSINVVKWLSEDILVSAGDDRDLHFWSISKA